MIRVVTTFGCGCLALAAFLTQAAAVELPTRKPGLWEMKMVRTGSPMPNSTIQHCTDAAIDKDMNDMVSPMSAQMCAKHDLQQTATGYAADFVCNIAGMDMTGHTDVTGDFNSAYTVKSAMHMSGGKAGVQPHDSTMTIEAKWLGACAADQKPGDIVMPGGMKMNVKDVNKLKALIPGAK